MLGGALPGACLRPMNSQPPGAWTVRACRRRHAVRYRRSRLVVGMPQSEKSARTEHAMDQPDPEREHRSRSGRIDDARVHEAQLMTVVHEHRATGRKDVATPIGVGAVDEAHDETLARLLCEHRRLVGATGPAADVLHDGDGERSGDAKDDRIQDAAIDPGHEPATPAARAAREEVRRERGREHRDGSSREDCHSS